MLLFFTLLSSTEFDGLAPSVCGSFLISFRKRYEIASEKRVGKGRRLCWAVGRRKPGLIVVYVPSFGY